MKAFLASRVRKTVLEELTFAKLALDKSDFLYLVDFSFLDLVEFAIVDRFLIFLATLLLSTRTVLVRIF